MKVLNPILDVNNPIFIKDKNEWIYISKKLDSLGYTWMSGNKASEFLPSVLPIIIYCNKEKHIFQYIRGL